MLTYFFVAERMRIRDSRALCGAWQDTADYVQHVHLAIVFKLESNIT